jgi:hypothetical protein
VPAIFDGLVEIEKIEEKALQLLEASSWKAVAADDQKAGTLAGFGDRRCHAGA